MDIGASSTLCAPALPGDADCGPEDTRVPADVALFAGATLPARCAHGHSSDALIVGRFLLIDQIGVGSFGEVWRANDALLDRDVAIKIARTPVADRLTPAMLEEARLAAQLRHPNIVCVHEVDAKGNLVFIVSDLIDGLTLAEWRTSCRPTLRTIVQVTEKIARALQHAHARGVVHRDLKPGNVMIGPDGEPTLVDFGLGLRASRRVEPENAPLIVGTPSYMSPEQASGASHRVDHRADLYALGVILFELLTGQLPFAGSAREVMSQRLTSSVPRPRDLNPAVSRDLDAVCLKCLAQSPADRYASANDLADDLGRCRVGKPVRARPIRLLHRAGRFALRHPAYSAMAALLLCAGAVSEFALRRSEQSNSNLERQTVSADLYAGLSWVQRTIARARTAEYRTAIAQADQVRRSVALASRWYYDLACIYAVASHSAAQDEHLAEPLRRALAEQYRTAAFDMLEQARAAGYFRSPDCCKLMPVDPHLKSLHNDPKFAQFVQALQEKRT